jgi:branched-chain amino acid transport system substrate-binding protein
MNSNCSISASQIYEVAGIAMITPSSTNPALTEQNLKYTFRVCGRDDIQAQIAADFICDVLKPRSVYLVGDYSIYSRGILTALKESIAGRVPIRSESAINQGDTTFNDLISDIKRSNPGLIYFGGYDPEAARLIVQLRQAGVGAVFMGADGLASDNFLKVAGVHAESTFFTFGPAVEDLGSAQHFVRVYKDAYRRIDRYAPYAYDAVNILLEAYCRAKDRSIADILRAGLFDGALGLTDFDDKGDVQRAPYMVWIVKAASFIPWSRGL